VGEQAVHHLANHASRLGVVGLGTGHDLSRTLELPSEPARRLARLADGIDRRVDLVRITFGAERPTS
jgi:diacylglycerol kinase family enzyme